MDEKEGILYSLPREYIERARERIIAREIRSASEGKRKGVRLQRLSPEAKARAKERVKELKRKFKKWLLLQNKGDSDG